MKTEREVLIDWLSTRIAAAHKRVAELQAKHGKPAALDRARAELTHLQGLRSRVAVGEYPAIDEARTMKVDEDEARS